jgi:hypothetical protein
LALLATVGLVDFLVLAVMDRSPGDDMVGIAATATPDSQVSYLKGNPTSRLFSVR